MANHLTGISSMATKQILAELAGAFTAAGGPQVAIESVGGVDAARRVRAGETFDLVVLAGDVIDALAAEGFLQPGSATAFARSGIAVAVKAGAPRPDLSSADAVRAAMAQARSIGYSTGPSGNYLMRLIASWGLTEALKDRLVQAKPGAPVAALLAQGEAELGFQQLSELITAPGIDVAGPLPDAIQSVTVFTGAIGARARDAAAARRFLDFIASPAASDAKRRQGMA